MFFGKYLGVSMFILPLSTCAIALAQVAQKDNASNEAPPQQPAVVTSTDESPATPAPTKVALPLEYLPVPPSAEELATRDQGNPKKDGALTLANLDRSTPISADPGLPNYSYYHGQPVPLPLDASRLAIRVPVGTDLSNPQARTPEAIGLAVTAADSIGIDGWYLVKLAQPLADVADANQRIQAALGSANVEFASPVFRSLLIPDGWIVIAPDALVRFKADHAQQAQAALAELAPTMQIKEQTFGGMSAAFRLGGTARNGFEVLAASNRLAQDPRVQWAEPEMFFSGRGDIIPNDPEFDNLWGIRNTGQNVNGTAGTNDMDMDGEEAWEITPGAASVRILVIDTGVEQTHPDINQNAGRDFTTGAADGVAGGGPVNACDNHGTAVAGCVSASSNNSTGVIGIAPWCKVISARCMIANTPTCSTLWSSNNTWTVNALNWAVNNGLLVTNNSNAYGAQSDAIDAAYLNAYGNGLIHFASTGNNGGSSIAYPASADTVNAVGNIQQDGTRNPTSQFGTGIDFSAPGTNIRTTDRTGSAGYANGDYAWVNGTSFASPYAAGVAALVKTAYPSWSPATVETAMKSGATNLGAAGYDTTFGWGLVNALKTLTVFGPGNDLCTNPYVITGPSYNPDYIVTYTTTVSTYHEPQESCEWNNVGVSNSVWYSYTPQQDGTIDVNTWGSNYDTVLSIFDGCDFYFGTTLIGLANQLGCNDDINGTLQSEILGTPVTAGHTYLIKASDYDPAPGGGNLYFDLYFHPGPPPNDHCFNRLPIPGGPGAYSAPALNTVGATVNPGDCYELIEPGCGHPSGNSNSVWYSFIPTVSGSLTLDTFGSDYDTVLTLYNGTAFANPCGDGNGQFCMGPDDFGYFVCNDDANGTYQSLIANYQVTAGHVFVVKVSDYDPSPGGGWLYLHKNLVPNTGDVNGDGGVNAGDIPFMVNALITPALCGGCNLQQADINGDGVANGRDLQPFINLILGS